MSIKKTDKRFVDITGSRLSSTSRLNTYNIFRITETNQHFLNHFKYFEISKDIKTNDMYFDSYESLEEEWWDNISYIHYGTSYYWYLLCVLNDVINPYEEIHPGKKIKILKKGFLYDVIKDIREISKL